MVRLTVSSVVLSSFLVLACSRPSPIGDGLDAVRRPAADDAVGVGDPPDSLEPTEVPAPMPPPAPATDAASEVAPSRCKAGAPVYGFRDGDRFLYGTADTAPDGFTSLGAIFALAPADAEGTRPIYLLRRAEGDDALLTLDSAEGAGLGYTIKKELGVVYETAVATSTPLLRFVQPSPLRHAAGIDATSAPAGFERESGEFGFVCPAP